MKKSELTELMNRSLDGDLDSRGKEALQTELNQNEEARRMYESMQSLDVSLQDLRTDVPGKDMKDDVMREIRQHESPDEASSLFSLRFMNALGIRFVFMLIIGVGIGYGLTYLLTNQGTKPAGDDLAVFGTMGDLGTLPNFSRGDEFTIDKDGVTGTVKTQYSQDMIVAEIDVTSLKSVAMKFHFDDVSLKVYGLKTLQAGANGSISSSLRVVHIDTDGQAKYIIFFKRLNDQKQTIRCTIETLEGVFYENTVISG